VAEDGFSERYGDLLFGSYDCVDRVVLNAYYPLGHNPGGFRTWWRRLHGNDEQLDNAHLMRMAGRFARRVRASATAHGISVIDCKRGERKHDIAEEYLATHDVECGVFLILVARAVAPVWEVTRTPGGKIANLAKKRSFVNHYSFHIMDPEWGHMTIKMSGHPPFGAQIILNGHEYVAAAARAGGIGFVKEGNCFTRIADPAGLAQVADTLSQPATIGRLSQVCDRWIYTACLCFGLDIGEQVRTGFGYGYSVYQAEYSRNLLFSVGAQMDRVFDRVVDRTRSRLDVPILRTLFGAKQRPGRYGTPELSLRLAAVIETPRFDLTLFKVHFGHLTLKAYTKGEHVLRFEAVVHNTRALRCGRVLDNFPTIIARLAAMVDRFTTTLDCVDTTFIGDDLLDRLPAPAQLGATRVGGVDLNKPRIRDALSAVLALSATSEGFTVAEFTTKVHTMTGHTDYTIRQAAYDLRKLRGKELITKPARRRRYHLTPHNAGTIAALLTLREHVIAPILAGIRSPRMGRKPITWTPVDRDYEKIRINMQTLFHDLGLNVATRAA
jgi:DNA-binding transcriptional ArsR family regulator